MLNFIKLCFLFKEYKKNPCTLVTGTVLSIPASSGGHYFCLFCLFLQVSYMEAFKPKVKQASFSIQFDVFNQV